MKILGPSWRTTMSGAATIMASLANIADGIANNKPIDWTVAMTGLMSGIGLLFARDNKVRSVEVLGPPK